MVAVTWKDVDGARADVVPMEVGEAVQSLVSRTMSLVIAQKKEEHEPRAASEASPVRSPEDVGKGLEKWREEELDDRDKDCCSICLDPFTDEDPAKKTTCGYVETDEFCASAWRALLPTTEPKPYEPCRRRLKASSRPCGLLKCDAGCVFVPMLT